MYDPCFYTIINNQITKLTEDEIILLLENKLATDEQKKLLLKKIHEMLEGRGSDNSGSSE